MTDLGWSEFFADQLHVEDEHFTPHRIAEVHRARLSALAETGLVRITLPPRANTSEYAVGDWVLVEPETLLLHRRLDRKTLLQRHADASSSLAPWCVRGQTVALVGSSGVGKSTLVNTLAGAGQSSPQQTGGIREQDAKGRHTTTARSLHAISGGGWIIDTPGMRNLHVGNVAYGIDTLFAEITELAPQCKFSDCSHAHEPGCAVRAAVASGALDEERVARWRKLLDENVSNTPVQTGPRGNRTTQRKHR